MTLQLRRGLSVLLFCCLVLVRAKPVYRSAQRRAVRSLSREAYSRIHAHEKKALMEVRRQKEQAADSDEFQVKPDALEEALFYAGYDNYTQEKRPVIMVLAEANIARLHLPLFINSLSNVGLADQLVVYALDPRAKAICTELHSAALCVDDFGSQDINGNEIGILIDAWGDFGPFGPFYAKGWLKTSLTYKTLLLGYDIMFMDVDAVIFQNPFLAIEDTAEFAVTVDCHEYYTPYADNREAGGPNLGVTFFRNTETTVSFAGEWLERRSLETWDQTEYQILLEALLDERPWLEVQILKKDQFPVLCCEYCNNFLKPLTLRSEGWQDHCPKEQRDKWVVFHATCMHHYRAEEGIKYDGDALKQNIMFMVADLKEQDHWKDEFEGFPESMLE